MFFFCIYNYFFSSFVLWQCYCLGFQVAQKVAKGAEIDRKSLFYNLERSSSIFPRKRILLHMLCYTEMMNIVFCMAAVFCSPCFDTCLPVFLNLISAIRHIL